MLLKGTDCLFAFVSENLKAKVIFTSKQNILDSPCLMLISSISLSLRYLYIYMYSYACRGTSLCLLCWNLMISCPLLQDFITPLIGVLFGLGNSDCAEVVAMLICSSSNSREVESVSII